MKPLIKNNYVYAYIFESYIPDMSNKFIIEDNDERFQTLIDEDIKVCLREEGRKVEDLTLEELEQEREKRQQLRLSTIVEAALADLEILR